MKLAIAAPPLQSPILAFSRGMNSSTCNSSITQQLLCSTLFVLLAYSNSHPTVPCLPWEAYKSPLCGAFTPCKSGRSSPREWSLVCGSPSTAWAQAILPGSILLGGKLAFILGAVSQTPPLTRTGTNEALFKEWEVYKSKEWGNSASPEEKGRIWWGKISQTRTNVPKGKFCSMLCVPPTTGRG